MPSNPCHYERDHSKSDGSALLCVVLETETFTLNLFLQATTFLRPNFTTRTTNIQTLGLNLTNLKKHTTIKNERYIKPPIYRQQWRDWMRRVHFTQNRLNHSYALTIRCDTLPKQLLITIDKCEFKHKKLELISGSYCRLQLLSVCGGF